MTTSSRTTVLEVSGVQWASQRAVAEVVLARRPGVTAVEVNPVAQTATVTYDPGVTSVVELADWVRDCGYHCCGTSRPASRLRSTGRAACRRAGGNPRPPPTLSTTAMLNTSWTRCTTSTPSMTCMLDTKPQAECLRRR